MIAVLSEEGGSLPTILVNIQNVNETRLPPDTGPKQELACSPTGRIFALSSFPLKLMGKSDTNVDKRMQLIGVT